jgi:hypothetical protein
MTWLMLELEDFGQWLLRFAGARRHRRWDVRLRSPEKAAPPLGPLGTATAREQSSTRAIGTATDRERSSTRVEPAPPLQVLTPRSGQPGVSVEEGEILGAVIMHADDPAAAEEPGERKGRVPRGEKHLAATRRGG